ncbi:MAG: aminopeptidase P family protein [Candidatus Kapabacteria bacterium]|nr:aminopeptidase P family protein [Candidatus Kapabacteria bacterium]
MPRIYSLQEQARIQDSLTKIRLERLLPELMRREGVDMWLVIGREYNEDPVIKTMLPATWLSARRRTILLIFDKGEGKGLERLAVARYDVNSPTSGQLFKSAWNPAKQPNQYARLAELIAERKPRKIALNRSEAFAHADGLTAQELQEFLAVLPKEFQQNIVSGERLSVGWLETRTPEEMGIFPQLCQITHAIIAEGFSPNVIKPGTTTTGEMEWWFRERIRSLGLQTWFHTSVTIQRADPIANTTAPSSSKALSELILPGDLLHVDIGISYLGLNSDVQQHAYVCKPGESAVPAGLVKAFQNGNRSQDILLQQFKTGRTGNQMLKAALEQAQKEGVKATIYTHPIGTHGHAAGPAIGMWDMQQGVPGSGDYPLFPNTAYSIELNAETPIPEWGDKPVRIMLEEDAFFVNDKEGVRWLDGRQTAIILIKP